MPGPAPKLFRPIDPAPTRAELCAGKLLRLSEVAERLSVSKRVVEALVASGKLFSVKFGGNRRVPESAVTRYVAGG